MRAAIIAAVAAGVLSLAASAAPPPWSAAELETLRALWLPAPAAPPPDPSNRVADLPAAAGLGQDLFFDRRLSANGRVACATCHQPDHAFTDTRRVGRGLGEGDRRTMPVGPAVQSHWQFWDGRADSLWAQALGPMENPAEHGFTRTQLVQALSAHYREPYQKLFGPLPDMADQGRFPARASPLGDAPARAAWAGMTPGDRTAVDRAFSNFGKAVAAYERTLSVRPGRFDAYLAGLFGRPERLARQPLTPEEVRGLRLFIGKAGCSTCHGGPQFSNEEFANTGVPARPGAPPDLGRSPGVRRAMADPFNCKGAFSDAGPSGCQELDFAVVEGPDLVGAFRVPSLRGVARRAPYMHAGQFRSLEAVLDHYDRAPAASRGVSQLRPLGLSRAERREIIAFLRTLDETLAPGRIAEGADDRHPGRHPDLQRG